MISSRTDDFHNDYDRTRLDQDTSMMISWIDLMIDDSDIIGLIVKYHEMSLMW